MSFLADIQKFSKSSLKPTATEVMYMDGRRVRETKHGPQVVLHPGLGFIGDVKPDLEVAQMMPGLYFGSQDVAADVSILKQHGITHVLNVAAGLEDLLNRGPFTYLHLPLLDLPSTRLQDYLPPAFAFIDAARDEGGSVFVHCNAGVSRAASVAIAYVMRTEGLDFEATFERARRVRPGVRPNDGFRRQLKEYHPGQD